MKHLDISYSKIGKLGEDIVCKSLENKGFKILDRNYRKNWGEIDIIAQKGSKIYFFEVKSVSKDLNNRVTYETQDKYNPEDNVHPRKLKKIARVIETYLLSQKGEFSWQFDVYLCFVDVLNKKAEIKVLDNITLEK